MYAALSSKQVTEKDEIIAHQDEAIVDLVLTNADQAHEIEELKASLANKEAELAKVLSQSTTRSFTSSSLT
jgi:K+/H+ antiporter YhaU regulatory subunit KhtT